MHNMYQYLKKKQTMKKKCKFNRNIVKFCLHFCAESCWKMPVTNGNFISKKKERKILTIRYVEIEICYFTTQA